MKFRFTLLLSIFLTSTLIIPSCKNSKKASNKESIHEINITKISPEVVNFLNDRDNNVPLEKLVNEYGLMKKNEIYYLRGTAKMQKGASVEKLTDQGVVIGTQAGDIWTVSIPIEKVKDIVKMDELIYLESKKVSIKTE